MSLTSNFYAGVNTRVWTNIARLINPSDTNDATVWDDEATPATRDMTFFNSNATLAPKYSNPGAMLLPSIQFNGSNQFLLGVNYTSASSKTLSNIFANNGKTIIIAFQMTGNATNNGTVYQNSSLLSESGAYFGLFAKSSAGVHTLYAYNWDGNADSNSGITFSLNTTYVVMVRHDGTTLNISLLSGVGGSTRTDQSAASGNTSTMTGTLRMGRSYQAHYFTGLIGEVYTDNTDLGSTNTPLSNMVTRWLGSSAVSAHILKSGRSLMKGIEKSISEL